MVHGKIYCGLDVGSQRMKACVLKVGKAGDLKLIGVHENKIYGFKDGSVSDLGDLSECVHNTINELSKSSGVKIKEIELGIGGSLVDARKTNTVIPLGDNKGSNVITARDVKKVDYQARLLGIKIEEEILHAIPQYYEVDDKNIAKNPLGLYGRKLGINSLVIFSNINRIRNVVKAVNHAGYDVINSFFSSYASSEVVLDARDKMEGCVLIDIGAKTTSVLVFKEKILRSMDKISTGGDNFTTAIVDALDLPFNFAEDIKKSYAGVLMSCRHQEEEILVKKEGKYIPVKREMIYRSILPETELLAKGLRAVVRNSEFYSGIDRGITIIGGGALLPGIVEIIGNEINLPIRLGKISIGHNEDLNNGASFLFLPAAGLAGSGFRKRFKGWNIPGKKNSRKQYVVNKIKELYQEYF